MFEALWLQGANRRDTLWYRVDLRGRLRQRGRRGPSGATDPC